MTAETDAMVAELRAKEQAVEQAMRNAVETEITATILRWQMQNRPSGKFARQDDHNEESKATLQAWTYLGADLVYHGEPWQGAVAERLYRLAVDAAHSADDNNPELHLHKGIDYFMLGMAQLYQGKYQEAAHSVLLAVEEDTGANFTAEESFAAEKLRDYTLNPVVAMLTPAADLCRAAGLTHITDQTVRKMVEAMFYRDLKPPAGDY